MIVRYILVEANTPYNALIDRRTLTQSTRCYCLYATYGYEVMTRS